MQKIYLLLATCLLLSAHAVSQIMQEKTVKPIYAQNGIKKTIGELQADAAKISSKKRSPDSGSIKPLLSYFKKSENLRMSGRELRAIRAANSRKRMANTYKNVTQAPVSNAENNSSTQEIKSNFLALDFYTNPIGWPPDPSGAVSNKQIIACSNNGLKVFNKKADGSPILTPSGYSGEVADGLFISLEDFFAPVIPTGSDISDPHIRYDRLSRRWIVVAIEVNPAFENNLVFLAISDGDNISPTSGFTFYSFNSSLFPYDPTAPYAPFFDYPTLGVDNNAILIGGNQFGYDSLTNAGFVIDKNKLINGQLIVYPFELGVASFLDGSVSGLYTPQGVTNDDGTVNKSFFAGITYYQDGIAIAKISFDSKHIPWLSAETIVPVQPFNNPRDNASPGGLTPIDQLDTRLFGASIHKNKITGRTSLWTAHAIGVGQNGDFIGGSDSEFVDKARTGSRWYEIGEVYSNPVLFQLGTVNDNDEPSGRRAKQYFNPTIAMNGQGYAVLGGTTDAFDKYLDVFVAGRNYSDAGGTMQKPVNATNTTAIYAPYIDFGGGAHYYIGRWGDFSQTVVDPADDQTIWTFQEYADVDDSYGLRVVEVKAPPPATPLPLGMLSNKKDTTIVLKGLSVNRSGFFDPGSDKSGPGFKRMIIKSTGNIAVSNFKFISSSSISFKLNTANKPVGAYTLMITNPDGQVASTEYSIGAQIPVAGAQNEASDKLLNEKIAAKYVATSGVYPNPASANFTLQMNAAKDFTGKILLMNISGKIIYQRPNNFIKGSTETLLPLGGLSSGTYVAAIYNPDNVLIAVHTVVKQ